MNPPVQLQRRLGLTGAVVVGLGSILGTGVFVSIALAYDAAGAGVVPAVVIAAAVAACNGFSSAQLAANFPVSGGTYEYGHRTLTPALGFVAGWLFLCAKSLSAATAALGLAGYLLPLIGVDRAWGTPTALGAVIVLTVLTASGLRRSMWGNAIIVTATVAALAAFIGCGLPGVLAAGDQVPGRVGDFSATNWPGVLQASALLFVAYTGYGRIATMSEEVRQPRRVIPAAVIVTLIVTMLLYGGVAVVLVWGVKGEWVASTSIQASPLQAAATQLGVGGWLPMVVTVGAITAMLGVLLNLILGLSRVLLAMGRRGDMPSLTARLSADGSSPTTAVIVMGGIVAALVGIGSVKTTWSLSAFTVLIYYALTNAAALRLSPDKRLYHPWVAWCGLVSCAGLAWWVQPRYWMIGLGVIAAGLAWRWIWRAVSARTASKLAR
jgi:APA family basic amino acid/polyamine antiporter